MSRRQTTAASPRTMQGLSLIELMISMLIGLMVVGSAIGVFLSNQQTYRATEALARVQESARVGFELMARDVREAGGNACGKDLPVANVLTNAGSTWWSNWANGVVGHDDGAFAESAPGTDAIDLLSATSGGVTVGKTPGAGGGPTPGAGGGPKPKEPTSANIHLSTGEHGIEPGDILMVCDYSQASIFQATGGTSSKTIKHNTGGSESPGNCTKGLGLPVDCSKTNGNGKAYGANSQVVQLKASRWFVADTPAPREGRSLYRIVIRQGAEQREEITEGVQDMQIQYLLRGAASYVDASPGLNWQEVVAVRITLTVVSQNQVGTDGEVLEREIEHVVTLRNRIS